MKKRSLLFVVVVVTLSANSAIVPSERLADWNLAGVPGGIPSSNWTVFCNVVTNAPGGSNALGNGLDDDFVPIQNALNSCPSGQVVYVPSGQYLISDSLNITSGKVLRGSGVSTVIIRTNAPDLIVMGSTPSYTVSNMGGGYTKGSTNVNVTNGTGFAVGQLLLMDQINDWDNVTNGGEGGSGTYFDRVSGTRCMSCETRITAISDSTNIEFFPPMFHNFSNSQAPQAAVSSFKVQWSGLENLNLSNGTPSDYALEAWSIKMYGTYACWIKNVDTARAHNGHLYLYRTLQSEVRGCTFHGSVDYAAVSRGYGIETWKSCSYNLITDNCCWQRPGIGVYMGGGANVVSYNFIDKTTNGAGASAWPSINANHAPHGAFNLFEGNSLPGLRADHYFGTSSHNTFLRNHFRVYHDPFHDEAVRGADVEAKNLYYSFVGCIMGVSTNPPQMYEQSCLNSVPPTAPASYYGLRTAWRIGFDGISNLDTNICDGNVLATMIRHGNYDYYSNVVSWDGSIADHLITNSLYLTSKPAWFGNLTWPPFDPVAPTIGLIPAQARFLGMNYSGQTATAVSVRAGVITHP